MRICKITNNEVKSVVARTVKSKDDKLYYNISFGSKGCKKNNKLWELYMLLDVKYFKPETIQDTMVLDQDNYSLRPFKNKDGEVIKDKMNNDLYVLTQDDASFNKRDVLLFWEIPNFNESKVNYKIEGNHTVIGEGRLGRERGKMTYSSPAVVVELIGDCILSWESENYNQKIVFDYKKNNFEIGIINNKKE